MSTATSSAPSGSTTSHSLIVRVKQRNQDAWTRLVRLYSPVVYTWARKAGMQENDARDLVQEVFAGVLSSVEGFDPGDPQQRFRAWLWGVTRFKIADYYRDLKQRSMATGYSSIITKAPDLPSEPYEETSAEKSELARRAIELMQTDFEQATWLAFWRTTVDGVPAAEVASELGVSIGSVYTAKSRVLRRLRDETEGLL